MTAWSSVIGMVATTAVLTTDLVLQTAADSDQKRDLGLDGWTVVQKTETWKVLTIGVWTAKSSEDLTVSRSDDRWECSSDSQTDSPRV